MLRDGELDDVAGASIILVESTDRVLELLCGGVGGQLDADRLDADLLAVAVLHADVVLAGRVLPHQHGREPWHVAGLTQLRDALRQLPLDRGRGGLAIENLCSHVNPQWKKWRVPVKYMVTPAAETASITS